MFPVYFFQVYQFVRQHSLHRMNIIDDGTIWTFIALETIRFLQCEENIAVDFTNSVACLYIGDVE